MTLLEKPHEVIIADTQFLITESLSLLIQKDQRFSVNKIVAGKNELIEALKHGHIQILIIDPLLIDLTGLSELKEIKRIFPYLKVLVITNSLSKTEMLELNSIGISNIILKTAGKEEIVDALNAAIMGRKYYSNDLLELLFEVDGKKNPGNETGLLTNSEFEIVRLISEGLTTKEIASKKFISFHTVITHRKNIFRKLGVTSVSELLMYAIKAGWIDLIEYNI